MIPTSPAQSCCAPALVDAGGVYGTVAQVRDQLQAIVTAGANHLILNPVSRYREHLDLLGDVISA